MSHPNVVILKSLLGAGGGLEKYTTRLAKAFKESGCRVTILTSTSKKRPLPVIDGIEIISLCNEGLFSVLNILNFANKAAEWLSKNPSPIIFGLDRNFFQTHYRAGNGVHAAYLERRKKMEGRLKGIEFVLNPLHRMILSFEKKTFESKELQCLFTNSRLVRDEILYHYKVEPTKIEVVHNGVEWSELQEAFDNFEQQRPRGDAYQLLFVGHGYKRKGLDLLLKALAKQQNTNFELSIVGKDKNQKCYEKLVKDLNLSDKVHFFGTQSNLKPFYQKCDALVIPSIYDPFANVTVEALSMGLYVLSSSSNGASEVLTPRSGIIIKDLFDKNEFASCLTLLMKSRKSKTTALEVRESVKHLDFKKQLSKIVSHTLCPTHATIHHIL